MCFPQVVFSYVPVVALFWVLQVVGYPSVDFSYILTEVQIFSPPNDQFPVPGTIHLTVFLILPLWSKHILCLPFAAIIISFQDTDCDGQTDTMNFTLTCIVNSTCCILLNSKDIVNEKLKEMVMASCKMLCSHFLGNTGENKECPQL